jgi:pimeloyl-ACP methyl ester carboxylesterase
MEHKDLLQNDASLHYALTGQGKPVILLHGFGEDGGVWSNLATELAKNYLVILPDIPGSGQSEILKGQDIGMEDYAESLHAILKNENIEKCTLIGHSMGGYISLAFAQNYPQMLDAFGLFHSSAYADDDAKKETRKKGIEFIQQNGAVAFLNNMIPGLFADAEKSKEDIAILLEKAKTFEAEALVQYYEAMIARPDRTEVLKKFQGPVLIILGRHDKAIPLEQGLKQSHLPNISHIHVLNDSGHMGMLEEPSKSLLKLAYFLSAVYV